jgi:prepilin-type N-terminal cleavage/methylation domain-containing protein
MSTAETTPRARRLAREAGLTLIEMSITMVIVAMMSLVVERVLSSTQEAERYLAAVRTATERGQKITYDVTDIVSASRKLYGRDATGLGYLAKLDLTRDPLAPGVRLPKFDEVNPMGPDTAGDPRTGNGLLFVREADAAPCVANPLTAKIRYIDTYRFIFVYPHRSSRTVVNGQGQAWDLCIWRSVPFPSRAQILAITSATEKQNVIKDLYSRYGYDTCWDPNGTVSTTFYGLDVAGNMAAAPTANFTIEEDLDVSERGRLVYADVQLAATDVGSKARSPVFSLDPPATWNPHGFEVKIVGASGSRKVWIHIVVEAQASQGRVAVMESTMIASTRDL